MTDNIQQVVIVIHHFSWYKHRSPQHGYRKFSTIYMLTSISIFWALKKKSKRDVYSTHRFYILREYKEEREEYQDRVLSLNTYILKVKVPSQLSFTSSMQSTHSI